MASWFGICLTCQALGLILSTMKRKKKKDIEFLLLLLFFFGGGISARQASTI
jgi:hypothetical protein